MLLADVYLVATALDAVVAAIVAGPLLENKKESNLHSLHLARELHNNCSQSQSLRLVADCGAD